MLSFKPAFSLSSFTFLKRLFSSSLLSAIKVVSSAYLSLLLFPLAVLQIVFIVSKFLTSQVYIFYCLPASIVVVCCSDTLSCVRLGDPTVCSMPGFPIFHYLPELAQTHVQCYPSLSLSPPSPPVLNPIYIFQLLYFIPCNCFP